jgi:hypothetical protein
MSKRFAWIQLAFTGAASAAVLGTTTALAATTWTVQPGGAVTAKLAGVTVRDGTSGYQIKCPSTVKATLKSGTGASCFAKIDGTGADADNGTLAINYTNSTHKLKLLAIGGNLHFYQAMGCSGLIRSQDRLTLSGAGLVTPAQKITSP